MLRIVTPLATLPLVLLALAEPDRDAVEGEEDEAPSRLGPASDVRRAPALDGRDDPYGGLYDDLYDDLYTVQVIHTDAGPGPRAGAEPGTGRPAGVTAPR
ncbi:hypothetical protein [Streptomyces macrosporus]|uniref:Uncharacterized protein n=1 Tax=Streptomyces macrosporus TaxID=44032 RepID=A0ABN3J8B9_9ACTN